MTAVQMQERVRAAHIVPLRAAAVALVVRDLDRVGAYYQNVVGLAVLGQGPGTLHLGAGGIGLLDLLHAGRTRRRRIRRVPGCSIPHSSCHRAPIWAVGWITRAAVA